MSPAPTQHFAPSQEAFSANWAAQQNAYVACTLTNDCDTPVAVMLKLARHTHMPFLMESVEGGAVRGRYSIIGRDPDLLWRVTGQTAAINRSPKNPNAWQTEQAAPLASLRQLLAASQLQGENLPQPLPAGLFGYLGYGVAALAENLPTSHGTPLLPQEALMMRPSLLVIVDQIESTLTLVAPAWYNPNQTASSAYQICVARLQQALAELSAPLPLETPRQTNTSIAAAPTPNMTEAEFIAMVARAKEYILAGDIFQVVLSQRFAIPFAHSALDFYRAIRRHDPSPFLFCFDFGDHQLIGTSPEILVRVRAGQITVRPIAGTRPRGQGNRTDAELATDLLSDPKELAEHLMLVDLGRNDVARVAKSGSVRVTAMNTIEHYRHVMHIVSNVVGELRDDCDMVDALLAGFPAGTVSGAPKIRAMEIINELEPTPRGTYAGCVGYFGSNGNMDTCIAIRTALLKEQTLYVQAGAGIVYDSQPQAEYQETLAKARTLLRTASALR